MNRCEVCTVRLPRKSERCDNCGAGNAKHSKTFSLAGVLRAPMRALGKMKERYPNTWPQIAGLWGTGIALFVLGIGIAIASDIGVFLILIGLFISGVGVAVFFVEDQKWQLMSGLGVDADSHKTFEQERKGEHAKKFNFGHIIVTENWVHHDRWFSPVLLPLKEVLGFEKAHINGRHGSSFHVRLHFKKQHSYRLPCDFDDLDRLMALLTERCPGAQE